MSLCLFLFSCKKKDIKPLAPNYEDSVKRNLWGYYTFNNGSFEDKSGNGHNMRGVNGTQFGNDKANVANNALSFDGINDYTVIDAGTNFPESNFSVSLLMFAEKTSSGRIFVKGNFNDAKAVATTFGFDDDNKTNQLFFTINKETDVCNTSPQNSSLTYLNTGVTIAQNTWYSIVVSHVNGTEYAYINGQLVASRITPTPMIKSCINAPFYFGIWWLQDLRPYMGKLDDVRIYTRGLSDAEIKFLSDNSR